MNVSIPGRTGGLVTVRLAESSGEICSSGRSGESMRVPTLLGVKHAFESLWREPAAQGRPSVGVRDRVLGAAVAAVVVLEVLFRPDLTWRPAAALFGLGLAAAATSRRPFALAGVAFGFGGFALLDVTARLASSDPIVLYAGTVVLILSFALVAS